MKHPFLIIVALCGASGCGFELRAAEAPAPPPSAPAQRSAAELEKLAMPIALHPDPLLAIMLPAAVYPLEIVQAARFVRDTNNLPKVDQQSWDANVKAVAKIPELISQLDKDLEWTVALGQAFLDQPKELMDTIQSLRAKAHQAGTLQTTPQQIVTVTNVVVVQTNVTQVVTVTNQIVQVAPANPQVVYVPTYPPAVYYPPPGYVYNPVAPLVSFGVAVGIGAIIANNCDWHGGCVWVGGGGAVWVGGGGDVDIDIDRNTTINRGDRPASQSGARTGTTATQQKWQPDQSRLNSSGAASPATREARGWSGASTQPATRPAAGAAATRPAQQPAAGAGAARPATPAQRPAAPTTGARPTTTWQQPSAARPTPSPSTGARPSQSPSAAGRPAPSPSAGARPASPPSVSRPSPQPSSAFGGVSSGSAAHSASSRGAVSRGGGGAARGGGGRR
ncbi:MAG: DUF3300 domain-containing protein [Verrucomicrobia bacterium]|nr:DUF3300 domain-containing protein [Verrucomicrobiota bacterium]